MTARLGTKVAAAATFVAMLAACGGSDHDEHAHVPTAAELVGTYDVHTTQRDGITAVDGIGVVGADDDLRLVLTIPAATLSGSLHEDGTITFTGRTRQTDSLDPVTVTGKFEVRDGTIHFVGVRATEVPSPLDLTMERALDADLRPFAGLYRLAFDHGPSACRCSTTAALTIAVDDRRFADATPLSEIADDGSEIARIAPIYLTIAPSGRFQLEATYALADGSCPAPFGGPCFLVVDGILSADGAPSEANGALFSGLWTERWEGPVRLERSTP